MSDVQLDNQSVPSTPASGKSIVMVDSQTKKLVTLDDSGALTGRLSRNYSTASQGAGFSSDTYVTNSDLLIPSSGLQAGMVFRWKLTLSKTGAGTAAAAIALRLGSARTTSDTAILTLTQTIAQAANANGGAILEVVAVLRNTGASGVLAGGFGFTQSYGTTAGTQSFGGGADGASSSFDTTGKAGQYMGLSINGGASAAWTITSVHGELLG